MALVVADAGPLHYLLLFGHEDVLPALFGAVTVPAMVRAELCHGAAPAAIRLWASGPPEWVVMADEAPAHDPALAELDAGEAAAIAIAQALRADLVLMDDRAGVAVARARGLTGVGTLGVLDRAALRGLIAIEAAMARLRATNFRIRPALLDALVARHRMGAAPKAG